MTDAGGGETRNMISGGSQGLVLQGRDFSNVTVTVAPAAAVPVALAQLPPLVAGFTGREQELAQITTFLDPACDAAAVVVSAVAGLAGVGKTALTIQAAYATRQAGWFPGGVLYLDLHGYDDAPVGPGQALDALLRALGIAAEHIPSGTEQRAAMYRSALAQISAPVLIIADNASVEAQVRPLLPGPGPHRVVVTSRHTLAGLPARLLDVGVLDDEAAVALLDVALQDARPGDDRLRADRPEALRLARLCGGLPLALQITAALLKADPSRTVSEMAEELGDEIRRLEALRYDDGSGTSAPSVAAAFELSYRQLDETAARLFRLLPVNPGPNVSTAAVAVLADLPVREVRRIISELVRAHLIEAAAGTAGRWQMHDLLRLYTQQLSNAHADNDAREQARDRLLRYYLDSANAASDQLRVLSKMPASVNFADRDDALAWLDIERSNLVAAVIMAARTDRDQTAIRLPLSLNEYFALRRRFEDQVAVLTICRDATRRLGEPRIEAGVLNDLSLALWGMRRFEEAITAQQEAVAIFQETGDRSFGGLALTHLGVILREMRRFEDAITAHQQAVAIFQETGDRHREGGALNNLAAGLGDPDVRRFVEAIAAYREAVAIFQETGDRQTEGRTLTGLGIVLMYKDEVEEAIVAHQQAAAIFQKTGDRHSEGMALNNLGLALSSQGRIEEAVAAQQEAAAIFQETGDRHNEAGALNNLGQALSDEGRTEEAITAYQSAATVYEETGDQRRKGKTLIALGITLQHTGKTEEAITAYEDATVILRETGDRHYEGRTLIGLGIALRDRGRIEEAIAAHQNAAAILRETGDRHSEGIALDNLKLDLNKQQR